MLKMRLSLSWKMFLVYLLIILIGTLILTAKNVWVNQSNIADLKKFFFGAILFFNLIFLLIMQVITIIRFRSVHAFFHVNKSGLTADQVFLRLLRFPYELFWSMIIVSFVLSILFHIAEIVKKVGVNGLIQLEVVFKRLDNLMSEMALAITLAVMVYSLLRITLKPYVRDLRRVKIGADIKRTSIAKPFLLAFVGCSIVISFDVLRNIVVSYKTADMVNISALIKIVAVDLILSFIVFTVLIWELRSELRYVESDIRSLVLGTRMELHKPISIRVADEIGQLAESFNMIQHKIIDRYQRLDGELILAYAVQQMLLPAPEVRHRDFYIQAIGRRFDAVEEWYDILPMPDGGIAVTVGKVSTSGMPAALATSTAIFVLRSVITECNTAYEAITQTKEQLIATLPHDLEVHLGIALFNPNTADMEFAGDSEIHIVIERLMQPELAMQSDPIQSLKLPILSGDRIVLGSKAALSENRDQMDDLDTSQEMHVVIDYKYVV